MNWVDIVIIIYLALSIISGFAQGLIRTLLSIIGLIIGIILAAHFYKQLGNILTFISNRDVANIIAFIIILLVIMGIAALIAHLLRSLIKAIMLGWIDRLGGAVLGLILGALSVSAILAIVVKYTNTSLPNLPDSSWINSHLCWDSCPVNLIIFAISLNSVNGLIVVRPEHYFT
jgi:membrane protein required for colicin V production